MRWIRVVYSEFDEFTHDAELLIMSQELFNYVEGFVFLNSDDPITGWPSVPLNSNQTSDPIHLPQKTGSILYCLEVALHYNNHDDLSTVNMVNLSISILFHFITSSFLLLLLALPPLWMGREGKVGMCYEVPYFKIFNFIIM